MTNLVASVHQVPETMKLNNLKRSFFLLAASVSWVVVLGQGETCATAFPITSGGTYSANGPSSGLGHVPNTCQTPNAGQLHADWYVYTPSYSGTVNIRSCGSPTDTRFSVLTGTCGALTCIAGADDECLQWGGMTWFASEMTLAVTAGTDYYIQWDNFWSGDAFDWELGECFGSVQGVTYRDQNSNGVFDGTEILAPVMLQLTPGGSSFYSDGAPYAFCSDSGSYTITPANPPQYHTVVPPSRSYSITAQGQLEDSMDFAFQPIPGIYNGSINLWGWNAWIGNQTLLYITYCNQGTELLDGTVGLALDPDMTFVSSMPAPTTSTANGAAWNFNGMMPGLCTTITIQVLTDSTVVIGDTLTSTATMQCVQSDISISDNLDQNAVPAVTSYDPNDKAVDLATLTPAEVSAGKALEYTVRFQNTGTMPAVNIVIRDTMDTDLDLGTFEMIGASHPYTLSIVDGTAIWSFQGIMLPDSASDEPGSHGAIHYRIAPKTNLMLGDEITNRADIYFDYNTPVLTNTVVTTVSDAQALATAGDMSTAHVFPSPSEGLAYVQLPGSMPAFTRVDVLDATGRVMTVSTAPAQGNLVQLDLTGLANGPYTVRVHTAAGTRMGKVVVRR